MPRGTTPFVRKTWDMLSDEQFASIVCWTRNGECFAILDADTFTADVLPKFFKHGNLGSFIRQLNTYGFKKVASRDSREYEFNHKLFHRDHEELLPHIVRRTANSKAPEDEETTTQGGELLNQLVENNKELMRRLKQLEEQHRKADSELSDVRKELVETRDYAQRLNVSLQWKGNQHCYYPRHPPPSRPQASRIPEQRHSTPSVSSPPGERAVFELGPGLLQAESPQSAVPPPLYEFDASPFHVDLLDSFWNAI